MTHRFSFDLGTSSLGWCVIDFDPDGRPCGIKDIGVRIYHDSRDPQSGTSLASDRRAARGARRNRDRYLKRRERLMNCLIKFGLMPDEESERKELEGLDPYLLRADALDKEIPVYHVGRALFHMNQRRGFRSNRIADAGSDEKDDGIIRGGVTELDRRIAQSKARTLGEYLYRRRKKKKGVRARPGAGFFPSRQMLAEEFEAIWTSQAVHHPAEMTDDAKEKIQEAIFFQRNLHAKEPGRCELNPHEFRAPRALPLTQRFRMWQEIANLKIIDADETPRSLDPEQRAAIYAKLQRQKTVSFGAMHKLLKLDQLERFNLEDGKRKGLNGDETAAVLAKDDLFGKGWFDLDEARQDEIVGRLLSEENESALAETAEAEWGLDAAAADRLVRVRLPQGYGRVGPTAMAAIIDVIRDQGLVYADAAKEAGYHHSDHAPKGLLGALPYYGEVLSRYCAGQDPDGNTEEEKFGTLANPTVHVGLNQLRRVYNALANLHGAPQSIIVELARELKLSQQQKQDIQRDQARNQKRNEEIAEKLVELRQEVTGANIRRYKLWEEQGDVHDRRCPFTGDVISGERLFSEEFEIEHLLPFSRTLDDGVANKVLCHRDANRAKGNRSPFEAFGDSPKIGSRTYDWEAILRRADSLPNNKRWRFGPDAMERFELEEGFIARQLTDTAYLARVSREYLSHVCADVSVTPGRLTALIRGKWGLNDLLPDHNFANTAQEKNRLDHRHHAIDAFVIGLTDRASLQRIARAADGVRERLIDDMPEPWKDFRLELRDRLAGINVSHRPDHGTGGQLHEDTAYGFTDEAEQEEGYTLVHRKPLIGLTDGEMGRIRDPAMRDALAAHIEAERSKGKNVKQAQESFCWPPGTSQQPRRVRLLKKEAKFVPIEGPGGDAYKALIPGENHHVDIFEKPDGKWDGEGVSVFDANRPGFTPAWQSDFPGARLVMRVHKQDLMILEHEGEEKLCRVVTLEPSAGNRRLKLVGNHESGNIQSRINDKNDPLKWIMGAFSMLKERKARKVGVDVIGRLRDPGPP